MIDRVNQVSPNIDMKTKESGDSYATAEAQICLKTSLFLSFFLL